MPRPNLSPANKAEERVAQLECVLEEIQEFLEDQCDIVDAPDGDEDMKPQPNRAMQLSQLIDEAMGRRP